MSEPKGKLTLIDKYEIGRAALSGNTKIPISPNLSAIAEAQLKSCEAQLHDIMRQVFKELERQKDKLVDPTDKSEVTCVCWADIVRELSKYGVK